MRPAILSVPSALVARMAYGSGVSRSLYFSTVLRSMAEVVAPESSRMRTRWRVSNLSSGETCPDINKAVGAFFCARASGGFGRSRVFRGPDLLLDLPETLVFLLRIAMPTEQWPLQSGRPQCHCFVF